METTSRNRTDQQRRRNLRRQIDAGRMGLLILLAVSLLNQILLLFKADYHFLFSLATPYYLNWLVWKMTATAGPAVLAVLMTLLTYCVYAACWLMSGQRREWLMAALGLYGLDTVLLVFFAQTMLVNPASCLFEVLSHCVGFALLYNAVRCAEQLSKLPRRRRTPAEQTERRYEHAERRYEHAE